MTSTENKTFEQDDEWEPTPDDVFQEDSYTTPLGADGDEAIFRLAFDDRDRIVDFAIIVRSRRPDGQMCVVAEIDKRHGHLHVHYYDQSGVRKGEPRIHQRVATRDDVADAYDAAVDLVMGNWEDYKWRWRSG